MKLCINCRHYAHVDGKHVCKHDRSRQVDGNSLITGPPKVTYFRCEAMRCDGGICGSTGKLWKEREEITHAAT